MGTALDRVMPALRLLNGRSGGPVPLSELQGSLGCGAGELRETCRLIKELAVDCTLTDAGVRLNEQLDLLDAAEIYRESPGRGRVEVIDHIDSTNTELLRRAHNLAPGDCLLAEIQTAGRGRRAGRWYSSPGKQLTLSLAWPYPGLEAVRGLSIAAGVEIALTLERQGFRGIEVKWPNDLYYKDAKLGGILVETVPVYQGVMAIIGVGLNIRQDKYKKLKKNISSLELGPVRPRRGRLAAAVIAALRRAAGNIAAGGGDAYAELIVSRDHLKGRGVEVETDGGVVRGLVLGVNPRGELIVRLASQRVITLTSGHVR